MSKRKGARSGKAKQSKLSRAPGSFREPGITARQKAARIRETMVKMIMKVNPEFSRKDALDEIRDGGSIKAFIRESVGATRLKYEFQLKGPNRGQLKRLSDGKIVSPLNVRRAIRVARYWSGVKKVALERGWTIARVRRHFRRILKQRRKGKIDGEAWKLLSDIIYRDF